MSETITASLTVSGGDTITVNLNTAARGPAGTGGGGTTFVALTDASTADIPTINGPLASALSGKAPASGISPSAIAGTAVITTDPRLSDARTPTAHTHVVSAITPVSGQHLIGRHAGGNGAAQEVTVGNGLEFQGSGIRRAALTGDVTAAAGSNSTAIANDAVSNAKLANMEAATIKGRAAGGGTGDPQDLTASEARTALGSGATGDALFTAATPAAARMTLGFDGMVPKVPFTVFLESDFTTPSTSFVSVTGLSFPVLANKKYAIAYFLLTNKNDTSGLAIQFTGPGSPTKIGMRLVNASSSAVATNADFLTAFSSASSAFNTFSGDGWTASHFSLVANGANAGSVQLQIRAVTGGTAKIYAGSWIQVTEL